jgi:hypothetical protein
MPIVSGTATLHDCIRLLFSCGATMFLVPTARTCLVSFTDTEGIRHAVEVAVSSLYESAALAIGEFRRCVFTTNAPGNAAR